MGWSWPLLRLTKDELGLIVVGEVFLEVSINGCSLPPHRGWTLPHRRGDTEGVATLLLLESLEVREAHTIQFGSP